MTGLTEGIYTSAYAAQGYVPFGGDPSAFYAPLVSTASVHLKVYIFLFISPIFVDDVTFSVFVFVFIMGYASVNFRV